MNKAVNDRLGALGKALKRLFLFLTILMAFFVVLFTPLKQKNKQGNLKIVYPACVYHIIYLSNTADK